MDELIKVEVKGSVVVKSIDLVDKINEIREKEGSRVKLIHADFMKKIRKELEIMREYGLGAEGNISLGEYEDRNGQLRPMYLLNRNGALQMMNSESTIVRAKTIEYIDCLEKRLTEKQTPSYQIEDPIERAKAWIEEQEEIKQLELDNKIKDQVIGELQPIVDYTDTILQSTSIVPIRNIAKDYGMSAQAMNKILHDLKVQYNQSNQWLLYSKYQDKGYTQSKTTRYRRHNGEHGSSMSTQWTQKGRLFLYNLLKEEGILPVVEQQEN